MGRKYADFKIVVHVGNEEETRKRISEINAEFMATQIQKRLENMNLTYGQKMHILDTLINSLNNDEKSPE